MSSGQSKITYTLTDEAPALATRSLLPIVTAFANACDVEVETSDISLAGRLLAEFSEYLTPEQKAQDGLTELGELVHKSSANVIKTPNISASIPQIKEALKELKEKGYELPNFPDEPRSPEEKRILQRFEKVKGSAVNPARPQGSKKLCQETPALNG